MRRLAVVVRFHRVLTSFRTLLPPLPTPPSRRVHYTFSQNDAVATAFLEQELPTFEFRKTYFDIASQSDMWIWAQNPFIDGLYGERLQDNTVVGTVQIRQARVQPRSCGRALELLGSAQCFPNYQADVKDLAPFGPGGEFTSQRFDSTLWRSLTFTPNILNAVASYGNDGYAVELQPGDRAAAEARLADLIAKDFVALPTRAVAFSFNLYNRNQVRAGRQQVVVLCAVVTRDGSLLCCVSRGRIQ